MGEHSIIIPESRDIDRESGLRVVCESSRTVKAVERTRTAGGVRRRSIDIDDQYSINTSAYESSCYAIKDDSKIINSVDEGTRDNSGTEVKEKNRDCRRCRNRRKYKKKKNNQPGTSDYRGVVAASFRLLKRISLLLLSLVGVLIPSASSTSRGPLIVSSSCALVSLLVVGLLRPTMAVPTASNVSGNPSSSSSTSSNSNTPLVRMMQQNQRQQSETTVVDEEEANFESVVEATMNRRLRAVEDQAMHDESGNDDDNDDDFTPPLHQRESGLESRSRLGEAELDTIRRSIVEGLGLERIPDPSKANVSQTEYKRAHEEYLTRLQHSRAGKEGRQRRLHTFHATEQLPLTLVNRTRRSANSIANDEDQKRETNVHSRALYFPMEIPDDDVLVEHATLRFLLDPTGIPVDEEIRDIFVYRLTGDTWSLVSRHVLPSERRDPRWIEIDVTEIASFSHEDNDDYLGIKLLIDNGKNRDDERQTIITHPTLNVFTTTYSYGDNNDARSSRRKRRATPEHLMSLHKGRRTECRGDNKKCCRHEMTVIFKDLKGFEFIVQPKNFDAGYCKGRCPPRYNPAHHHALLQSLIWKEDKRKAPRPCCAPSKLDELEILYFDENDPTKLKVSSWKNMKVLECACS